ncbi:MAG: ATP-binding protein [Muribaculaceae bacterium]|nr:ATP-binding protein [Muribaculaceae bacterium]
MNFIDRDLSPILVNSLKVFPSVTLTGPRQSGKTTLCRHLFPELPYINMENIQISLLFKENPVGYLNSFSQGVIIDEAQIEPDLFKALQVVIDEDIHLGRDRKFIITGSSNVSIMSKVSESMAGRTAPLTLLPLSTNEILNYIRSEISTNELMFCGGYPKIWISPQNFRESILQSYIDTYVEKDLRQLLNVKDLNKFIKFLGLCAGRIGTELNKNSLAVETGVTNATIDAWISVLETSYIIWLLPPWSTNINKRLTKSPKLYFYDTGLLCTLLGINDDIQLKNYPIRGAIFENLVVNNFVKKSFNAGKKPRLSFYRDKTGREIDLILERPEGLSLFEIKASTGYNPDFFKNIRYFEKTFPDKVISSAIIYDGITSETGDPKAGIYNFRDLDKYI